MNIFFPFLESLSRNIIQTKHIQHSLTVGLKTCDLVKIINK